MLWGITGDTSMFFCSSVAASTSLFVFIPSLNEANVPFLDQQNNGFGRKGFVVCLQTFKTRNKTDRQKSLGSYCVTINQSNSKYIFF